MKLLNDREVAKNVGLLHVKANAALQIKRGVGIIGTFLSIFFCNIFRSISLSHPTVPIGMETVSGEKK
ncbi:MAG: hypothetical protein QMD94_00200 [Candidatus Omnitrophota bacterium]|nr:hypothetical protein [Candidatus Omnitrophota bacterium]